MDVDFKLFGALGKMESVCFVCFLINGRMQSEIKCIVRRKKVMAWARLLWEFDLLGWLTWSIAASCEWCLVLCFCKVHTFGSTDVMPFSCYRIHVNFLEWLKIVVVIMRRSMALTMKFCIRCFKSLLQPHFLDILRYDSDSLVLSFSLWFIVWYSSISFATIFSRRLSSVMLS